MVITTVIQLLVHIQRRVEIDNAISSDVRSVVLLMEEKHSMIVKYYT